MLISVIIPTYNRSHTLKKAIESVLLQKTEGDLSWELIVVDDGSEDNGKTTELLERFSREEPRMSFITTQNKGVSAARNLGFQKAKGEWIAFLDSDDEWLSGKLQAQYEHAIKNQNVWNQTQEIWIRNGKRVNPPKHSIKQDGDLFIHSLERCMVTPSSVLIQKKILEQEGGFDESYPACEDYELWLRLTSKHSIGLVGKNYLIRYGGHADQLSHKYPAMDRFRIRAMFSLWKKGKLSDGKRESLEKTLQKKIQIYREGCARREKAKEVQWCEELLAELIRG